MKKGISPNRQCGMKRQVHIKWPIPDCPIDTVFWTGYHLIEVEKSYRRVKQYAPIHVST